MKRFMFLFTFIAIIGLASTPARANTSVHYPDASVAFAQFVAFNQLAFIFWDTATTGDNDIFTVHVDSLANPIALTLTGAPGNIGGLAYWLNFLGFDIFGNMIFDVSVNQGFGWFFIGQFFL
jgi:hypothetical protein